MWNLRDLIVWRRARAITAEVFGLAESFPSHHRFGIASQVQRSVNSIGAIIAEASGRPTPLDRARFLGIAIASANQAEHHLVIAADVGLLSAQRTAELINELDQIRRMTKALRRRCLESEV